jgi:hypothetical protein
MRATNPKYALSSIMPIVQAVPLAPISAASLSRLPMISAKAAPVTPRTHVANFSISGVFRAPLRAAAQMARCSNVSRRTS